VNPVQTDDYPIDVLENAYDTGITMVSHELGSTSGILYADFGVDVSSISFEDIGYLQLFNSLLGSIGIDSSSNSSSKGNYTTIDELTQFIGMHTGGIHTQLLVTSVNNHKNNNEHNDKNIVLNDENFVTKLIISGKAISDKTSYLFQLFYDILLNSNLADAQDKSIEILKNQCSYKKYTDIPSSGHSYAYKRIRMKYSVAGMIGETMDGVRSVNILCNELLPDVEENWSDVLSKLVNIRDIIFDKYLSRSGMVINLTGDKQVLSLVEEDVKSFLNILPGVSDDSAMTLSNFYNTKHPWVDDAKKEMLTVNNSNNENEAIVVSTLVNYVGQGHKLYNEGEEVSGATDVITDYLRLNYLWQELRVLAGAYGAFNLINQKEGIYLLLTYRDPNYIQTLDVYNNVADTLMTLANDLRENPKALELSIISSIASLDGSVLSSEQMGWTSFIRWITRTTSTSRQRWRDDILNTTPDDFEEFAAKLTNTTLSITTATVCSDAAYNEANKNIHLERIEV